MEEKGSFNCEICKTFWLDKTSLDLHIKFKHGKGKVSQEYPCEVCGKSFPNVSRVNNHKKIHDKICPFSCDVCHKSFMWRYGLKRHKRTHTGARDHKCKECGKTFTLASSLERHSLVHTGERPFVCSYSLCHQAFNDRSTLRRHMILHTASDNPRKKCKV